MYCLIGLVEILEYSDSAPIISLGVRFPAEGQMRVSPQQPAAGQALNHIDIVQLRSSQNRCSVCEVLDGFAGLSLL